MCCTWFAGNTGRKNDAKNRHLRTIAQLCRIESSQLRHVSTIGKKFVKEQYLLHMSPQYSKLRPTSGWDRFVSLGHPSKFHRLSRLSFVTAATSFTGGQPNFARRLAVSCSATLYIHFRGSCPLTEFCHVQNSLCIQVLRWHILAALFHGTPSVGQPNFAAWYKELNYGTFTEGATYIRLGGHHVGHQPTSSSFGFCTCHVHAVHLVFDTHCVVYAI